MTDNNSTYFPQTHYFSQDNINFYHLNNHLFDPINLSYIIKNSIDLKVVRDYRPDLTTKDYDYIPSYIKVVNIVNGKRRGIYDYKKDEDIIVPMPDSIDYVNSNYTSILYDYSKKRNLDISLKNHLNNSLNLFSQVFAEKNKVLIFSYLGRKTPSVNYDENELGQKFPGII